MADIKWRMPNKFEFWMALIAAVALFAWFILPWETPRRLVEVIFVAAFLAVTVDSYLKTKLSTEIARTVAKDVSPFFFTYGLPRELENEVLFIRDITLMRRDLEVTYHFRNLHGRYLLLETEMVYTVENYSDQPQPFLHQVAVIKDKHSEIRPCQIVGVEAVGGDLDDHYSYHGDAVQSTRNTAPPVLTFSRTVTVSPNKGRPDNRFWWKSEEVVDDNDVDALFLPYPTINVTVNIPEKPPDLEVIVFFGHRRHEHAEPTPRGAPTRWRLNGAFLPWSSVNVEWKRTVAFQAAEGEGTQKTP